MTIYNKFNELSTMLFFFVILRISIHCQIVVCNSSVCFFFHLYVYICVDVYVVIPRSIMFVKIYYEIFLYSYLVHLNPEVYSVRHFEEQLKFTQEF